MTRTGSAVLVAMALMGAASVAVARASAPAINPEDEIGALEKKVNAAYEANDLPRYFSHYASDFSQFLPEGRSDLTAYTKEWTEYVGEGNRGQKVELSDMKILIGPGGNTAVASYGLHLRTKLKDGAFSDENNQESDVWFKRKGEWKIVFLHYSAAPKKKAAQP